MVYIRNSSLKKGAPLRKEELIHKDDIKETLYPLKESDTDYITMSGEIYKYYYDDLYFKKTPQLNKHNGYIYVSITCKDGVNRSRRLHVLMAKTFLFNPNPKKYKIVGHKDNDKTHYELSNLYWTDNQENTQKAVNDGLNAQKKAEEDEDSIYVKVIDKNTNKIVGIYGSLRECARCIDNITLSSISKVYKKKNYIPRNKKYIYATSNKFEFESYPELQSKHLIENAGNSKNPKVFRMSNIKMNYSAIFDNQTTASKICGIPQAIISHILLNRTENPYKNWHFELLYEMVFFWSGVLVGDVTKTVQNTVEGNNVSDEVPPEVKTDVPWNLTLVNRWNPIPENYEVNLMEIDGGECVDARIYEPLMQMLEDAREANWGQLPYVVSGYRTAQKQQQLYTDKIAEYRKKGYSEENAKHEAQQWVAVPGYSEHQLGFAVDINGATYDVYLWLQENSYKYGFIFRYPGYKTEITGVAEEVWHYRYVGVEAATEIYEQGICLEEYLLTVS